MKKYTLLQQELHILTLSKVNSYGQQRIELCDGACLSKVEKAKNEECFRSLNKTETSVVKE
jgi:hypothetical protein